MLASNHITSISEAILAKGRFSTNVFKFAFINRIVDLWNGQSVTIKEIDQLY